MARAKLLLLTGLLAASTSLAAAELKFGYVNTERIYREAAPAVEAQKRLDKEFAGRRDALRGMEEQAKKLEAQLGDKKLSDAERKRGERDLAQLERDYRAKSIELAEDYKLRRNEEFAAVQQRAWESLKQIAEKDHYDLILQDAVYVSPKFDLTGRLLKELEK